MAHEGHNGHRVCFLRPGAFTPCLGELSSPRQAARAFSSGFASASVNLWRGVAALAR